MGQIDIPGNLSGTTYRFTIAGDQPTREEFSRMQAVISDGEERFRQEFEASAGIGIATDDEPGTAIGRGLRRGIPQFQSALGTAAEYAGAEGVGEYLQNAAMERQLRMLEENPALLEGSDFRDVRGLGSALTYAGELLGEQAPLIGGTIGVGALTGGAGALAGLGAGAATVLGTTAGTLAVSGPQLFGSNLQRQEAQVVAGELASVDVGDAATAAVAQSGLELLSNLVLVGRIPASLGRAILQNATVEGLTEVGQQALERQQAGLPLDSEDAVREYLDAGVAGATLGGVFGGVGYGVDRLRPRPEETAPDPLALTGPEARLALPAPARGLPAPTPGLPAPPRGLPRPTTGAAPRGIPGPDTIPPSPESPRMAGTVPGATIDGVAYERGRSPALTPAVRVPQQPDQVRDDAINVPQLSPDAAVTAQSIGSDSQMLAAVEAIQTEGKATIPVIQNALGLSYNAARGVMMKLENVGAVSKAQGGRPRTLTLPFQITAVQGGGPGEVTITPTEDATPAGNGAQAAETSGAGELPATKPKRPRTRAGRGLPDAARAAAAVGEEPAGTPEEAAPEPVERPVADAERPTGRAGEQQPALSEVDPELEAALREGREAEKAEQAELIRSLPAGQEIELYQYNPETGRVYGDIRGIHRGYFLGLEGNIAQFTLEDGSEFELDIAVPDFEDVASVVSPIQGAPTKTPQGGTGSAQPTMTLDDGTVTDVVFFHPTSKGMADIQKSPPRAVVVRNVNGVQVPFYLSTGEGGKAGVPAGKWYPFFGIGGMGWYNKGTEAQIADYYGSPKLREAAKRLDAQYGDIRGDTAAAPVAYADSGVFAAVNRDMDPVGSPSDPNGQVNIAAVVKRVEGANWPAARERFIAGARGDAQPALTPERIADLQRRQRSGEDVSAEIEALQQEAQPARVEQGYDPRSGQLPGQVTAAAGQVIPSPGIAPSVGRTTAAQQGRMAGEIRQQQTRTTQRNRLLDRIAELRTTLNSQAKLRTLAAEAGIKPAGVAQRLRKQLAGLLAEQVATEQRIREARRSGVTFRDATAQERALVEAQLEGEYQAAREEFANVVYEQMSPELRADAREYSGAREMGYTDPLVPGDLSERIAPLLRMSRDDRQKTAGAIAAYEYFRKAVDPLDALVQIAYDVDPITVKVRKGTKEEPLTPYFEGTGRDNARKARKWVGKNLNPDVADFVDAVAAEASSEAMNAAAQRVNAVGLRRELRQLATARQVGDITEAQYQERSAELNQDYKDRFGFDESALASLLDPVKAPPTGKLRAMLAGLGPMMPMHPTVRAALQNNNLNAALQALAATSKTGLNRKLARRLMPYTGNTQVELVSDGDVRLPMGAIGVFDVDNNTIYLNEDLPFTEHTLLHEMTHVATEAELRNPASPTRNRLNNVYTELRAKFPDEYGATDLYEFVAEAFTNPDFQSLMSQIQLAKGQPDVFTRMKQAFGNFVRRLLGRPAKQYDAESFLGDINDEVDALINSILAVAPDTRSAEPAYQTAKRPLMARAYMSKPAQRAVDLTAEAYDGMQNVWSGMEVPTRVRNFVNNAFIPLRNMVDYATPYLPMARQAWDIVTGHHNAIKSRNEVLRSSMAEIAKRVPKDKINVFNNLRLMASLYEVNVLRTNRAYSDFSLSYLKIAKDGAPSERQYEYFKSKTERDARQAELNADRPESRSRAIARDPDPEKAAVHRRLQRIYEREFTPDMRDAYKRALGYFQYLHQDSARVFKARLDAMLPGQRRMQNAIYDGLFEKLFNENSLVAYQPLQREGRYWVAHSGRDPFSGNVEQYKRSFKTSREREQYIAELQALPESSRIGGIERYTKLQDFFEPNRPSPAFVAEVGRILDRNATAAEVQARKRARDEGATEAEAEAAAADARAMAKSIATDAQQSVVELALTMMPERSFLQAYKERSGVLGFEGGTGPIDNELSKSDTINLMLRKGAALSRQLADMEYGARAQSLRNEMKTYREDQIAKGISPARLEKLDDYYNTISNAMRNIYVDRHPTVRALNTASYMMTLGFNPSSAIMTFMAVPTIIGPYLAGRYGGIRTARAFNHAMKVLGGSGRTLEVDTIIDERGNVRKRKVPMGVAGVSLQNYDLGPFRPSESYISDNNKLNRYGPLQGLAQSRGLFADSIQYDMLDAENLSGHGIHQRFVQGGAWMMHTSERMVRESTLIAAYDLALQDMAGGKAKRADGTTAKNTRLTEADLQKAAEIAVSDTELTNGTIAAAGSPNYSQRGIMPLLYMFKRYPLAMYNLLATLMGQSFPSEKKLAELYGKGSPEYKAGLEGRAAARWQLGLIVGNVGLWAGAAGLPLYGALSSAIDGLFRDEDEPDTDTLLRMSIGELGFKGLGNYLLGAEMSSRIGLANMFYRAPIAREDQSWIWNLIEGAAGPAVGIAANSWPRAIGLWNDGEYWRATETAFPAQVRNFLRTARYAQSGAIESTRGDVITELNNGQLLGQLLGLAPADYIQQIEVNSVLKGIDEAIRAQRTQLLRRLNVARREGNAVEYNRVMREILEFTQEHPQFAIGGDTIQRSARTFGDTTQRVRRGIIYNSENERVLDRLAEQIESPSSLFQALGE